MRTRVVPAPSRPRHPAGTRLAPAPDRRRLRHGTAARMNALLTAPGRRPRTDPGVTESSLP